MFKENIESYISACLHKDLWVNALILSNLRWKPRSYSLRKFVWVVSKDQPIVRYTQWYIYSSHYANNCTQLNTHSCTSKYISKMKVNKEIKPDSMKKRQNNLNLKEFIMKVDVKRYNLQGFKFMKKVKIVMHVWWNRKSECNKKDLFHVWIFIPTFFFSAFINTHRYVNTSWI